MSGAIGNVAGQAARTALEAAYKHLPAAVMKMNEVVAEKGVGSWVWTADGNKYLDMTSGIGAASTGHCHPHVVKAVQQQAATLVHAQQNIFAAHEKVAELVQHLSQVMPAHLSRYFLCNSGSEAVDNAIKIARGVTRRQNIIAFDGGFHGRTYGAMALTSSKVIYRQGFGPFVPGVHIAPYPYCLHCKWQQSQKRSGYHVEPYCEPFDKPENRRCCNAPLEALEWMFQMQTHPSDTAAIILEPILGEGGFLTPPPGFYKRLRELCDQHGILLIADEVQAGAGRTGKWWGHQHFEASTPDLLIFAKGIASGYPFAGVAAREGYFETLPAGSLGGTYGGNAVACAAAVATMQAIESDNMITNAQQRGTQLMTGLVGLTKKYPIIDIRGRGLMVGVEFGGKDGGYQAEKGTSSAIQKAAFKRKVLFMPAGARESMRFLPPLNVTQEEVDMALDVFDKSCAEVFNK
eukprot:jgi/Chrzof1/14460/Cz09g03230.t1